MSTFQKVFLATAILATGLAVAILLGQPVVNKPAPGLTIRNVPQPVALTPPIASAPSAHTVPSVQLLPDADAPTKPANLLDAPALLPPLAPISSFSNASYDAPASQLVAVANAPPPRSFASSGPIAHFRNEAPRPLGNEPRTPPTIRRAPPVEGQFNPPPTNSEPYQVASIWAAAPPASDSASNLGAIRPATQATFTNTANGDARQPSPPPTQAAGDDSDESQTHVVADGDSLEKLAALYLSDPHRSKEIFELNRDVLSDPNLLPIGAELKIPDRLAHTSGDRQSRRPAFQGDAAVREAAMGDLVPIRSLPDVSANFIPPHAQLTRPVAAD